MKPSIPRRLLSTMVSLATLICFNLTINAEARTFTNTEGKSIEAEIVGVASGKVSLKMKNGKVYTLPFAKLSEADQTYIKEWHKKNKSMVKPSDFKLDVSKKQKRIRTPRDEGENSGEGAASTRIFMEQVIYQFKFTIKQSTPVKDVVVKTRIFKRTTTKGSGAEEPTYELILGEKRFESLSSKKAEEWKSTPEICEKLVTKFEKGSSTKKEEVIGIVVIVSAGGKELFRKYEPSTFERELKKLEEKNPELVIPEDKN